MNFTTFQPGSVLDDRFVIHKLISGGMGVAAIAYDRDLDRVCVLKSIRSELNPTEDLKKRFIEEAKALAMISSVYVVELHGVVSLSGNLCLLMKYCNGGNLRSRILKGGMSQEQALIYAIQISFGMDDCQRKLPGLTHRDLKPENLLFNQEDIEGPEDVLKIADFGLVKQDFITDELIELQSHSSIPIHLDEMSTRHESILGTIPYMSPEQLSNSGNVDIRSDIYSFGVILFEMLTGSLPYCGSLREIAQTIKSLDTPAPEPHEIRSDIDKRVSRFVTKCMSKNPQSRFQTWDEIIELWRGIITPSIAKEHLEDKRWGIIARSLIPEKYRKETPGQNSSKIDIKNFRIASEWQKRWQIEENSSGEAVIKFSVSSTQGHALRRAETLYKLNKEWDALQVINAYFELPSDYEMALKSLMAKFSEEGFKANEGKFSFDDSILTKELIKLRAKCYSAILDSNKKNEYNVIQQAITNANLLAQIFPNDSYCLCLAAQAFFATDQYDPAQKLLEKALTIDPDNDFVQTNIKQFWTRKGKFHSNNSQIDEALFCFEKLLEQNPKDERAWFNKGVVLLNHGRPTEALYCFEKASQFGHSQAPQIIAQIDKMLGKSHSKQTESVQHSLEAFWNAESLDEMERAVLQFPKIASPSFITAVSEAILQKGTPSQEREFKKHVGGHDYSPHNLK